MSLQIAVYIRLIATLSLAKELGRFAAFVLNVTVQAVLPLVFTFAIAARPGFGIATVINHFIAMR